MVSYRPYWIVIGEFSFFGPTAGHSYKMPETPTQNAKVTDRQGWRTKCVCFDQAILSRQRIAYLSLVLTNFSSDFCLFALWTSNSDIGLWTFDRHVTFDHWTFDGNWPFRLISTVFWTLCGPFNCDMESHRVSLQHYYCIDCITMFWILQLW